MSFIKEQYKNIPLPEKVKSYLALCRPFTGLGALIAGIFLSLFAGGDVAHGIFFGVVLMLLQFSGQSLNQAHYEEIAIDEINGKTYRPVVAGKLSYNDAFRFGLILNTLALGMAFIYGVNFGLWCSLISIFAVFYTYGLRVKKMFLVNNIWQGISRGLLPVLAIWNVYQPSSSPLPWVVGGALSIWITGAQTTKDFDDYEGDKAYGVKTVPVVLGKEKAILFCFVVSLVGILLLIPFLVVGLLPSRYYALMMLILPTFLIYYFLKRNHKNRITENNTAWMMFYLTLGLWYVILGVVG